MTSAYSTTDSELIAAYREASETLHEHAVKVCDAARELGRNKGVYKSGGGMFDHAKVSGLAPDDPNNPPDGWTYIKSRGQLEPRRGKSGDPARAWMKANEAPKIDVRGMLAERFGLPRYSVTDDGVGCGLVGCPSMLFHNETLWIAYTGRPGTDPFGFRDDFVEPDERWWTLRRPSEWYAAREDYEATSKAPAAA